MAQQTKRQKKKKDKKGPREGWRTARDSDIHELYELSVQEPEADIDLVEQVWRELRGGRTLTTVREDFCGTAIASVEWIKRGPHHHAIGVDLDPHVLEWGRKKVADRIDEDAIARLDLVEGDVLTANVDPAQVTLACNFSYYIFKTRESLRAYFKAAYDNLGEDGLLMLDAYGGSDSFLEMEEERHLDGFTYVWDQSYYNPVTGDVRNHIHFRFPDGSEIRKAFTYEWRLWTLPELRELLLEAGFSRVVVYWEGTDEESDEGNGEWEITERGEACPGWIAYVVAVK